MKINNKTILMGAIFVATFLFGATVSAMKTNDMALVDRLIQAQERRIEIPDSNLLNALKLTLGLNQNQSITKKMMEKLDKPLDLSGQKISNLKGLEYAVNISSLNLSLNDIEDASVLIKLPKLCILDLSNNKIKDTAFVGKVHQIRTLILSGNRIEVISDLKKLKCLTYLDISHNKIKDISSLNGLSELQVLNLADNRIDNVPNLEGCDELLNVDICNNPISDIASLKCMKKRFNMFRYSDQKKTETYDSMLLETTNEDLELSSIEIKIDTKEFEDNQTLDILSV